MSPLRILVIAALLYIGYRLIVGSRKKADRNANAPSDGSGSDGRVQDVLMEDPICHSLVPKQQAIHLNHQGKMVYFCSEKCCKVFIEKYQQEG